MHDSKTFAPDLGASSLSDSKTSDVRQLIPETGTDTDARMLVSLATYNEHDNLAPLISEIHKFVPAAEVLVIDDNSPDGTGKLADELAVSDSRIHVIHRGGKLGLGTALLAAMRYSMDKEYDFLINMDADFSHHPRYLPAVIAGMRDRDMMIGSRYISGGGTVDWPLSRKIVSLSVNGMVRLLMRIPAHDCSGAYRCYRIAKLRQTDLENLLSRGYSFQQEILYRCRKAGSRIGETPIIFENRRAGASKVNLKEVVRSISILFWIGIHSFCGWD
jgi:dolichol-phosphate mannosyltransferase